MSWKVGSIWLGYQRLGGRFNLKHDEMKGGVVVLGQGAKGLVTTLAFACNEAGLRTLVLDMDGYVSENLSGYISTYETPFFLYDALRIEENPPVHAQLIASAYSCALDLSFEQEAALNSVVQTVASERGVASPSALADLMLSPDSIQGRPADKLRIRLESLRPLNIVGETDVVKSLFEASSILNFRAAGAPEASETAAALFIAKMLALIENPEIVKPDVLIFTQANKLFRSRPVFRKSQRLLTTFTAAPLPKVLASDVAYGLDEDFLDTCVVKIVSSSVWNESGRGLILTPNMFMVKNNPYGYSEAFIPRSFDPKKGESRTRKAEEADNPQLTRLIIEDIVSYEAPTRASVVDYLSAEFSRELVERTIDRLQAQGYVTMASKQVRSGPHLLVLSLTEKGKNLWERMK